MALRRIVRFPDPFLRQPTFVVKEFGSPLAQLVRDMAETMDVHQGAGLAAIQVGASERLFIIEGTVAGLRPGSDPVAFVNPTIEWLSKETEETEEGCLSFPSIFVPVKRSYRARVRAQDVHGKEFVVEAAGLYARALQHEQDHLDNRLLYDYAGPMKRQLIKRKMEKMTDEEAVALIAEHGE